MVCGLVLRAAWCLCWFQTAANSGSNMWSILLNSIKLRQLSSLLQCSISCSAYSFWSTTMSQKSSKKVFLNGPNHFITALDAESAVSTPLMRRNPFRWRSSNARRKAASFGCVVRDGLVGCNSYGDKHNKQTCTETLASPPVFVSLRSSKSTLASSSAGKLGTHKQQHSIHIQ